MVCLYNLTPNFMLYCGDDLNVESEKFTTLFGNLFLVLKLKKMCKFGQVM